MEPKVSIILANYNNGKYLKKAIESVLDQTYDRFELIIIDDGSTDNSIEIIKSFSDERIKKIFEKQNRHVAYASNIGLKNATGEYIAIMDSDDIWDSQKLEKQIAFMEKNPKYGACFTRVHIIDENNELADEKYKGISDTFNLQDNMDQKKWVKYFFKYGNCLANNSVVMKKEALESINLYYDIACVPGQDYELWTRMVLKYPIYILQEKLTYYRWTTEPGKISGTDERRARSFLNVRMLIKMHYFDFMSDEEFVYFWKDEFINKKSQNHNELETEKAFLLMKNYDSEVEANFLGLIKLRKVLNQIENINEWENKYGIKLKECYSFYNKHSFYDKNDEKILEECRTAHDKLWKQYEEQYVMLECKKKELSNLQEQLTNSYNTIKKYEEELNYIYNSKLWKVVKKIKEIF